MSELGNTASHCQLRSASGDGSELLNFVESDPMLEMKVYFCVYFLFYSFYSQGTILK